VFDSTTLTADLRASAPYAGRRQLRRSRHRRGPSRGRAPTSCPTNRRQRPIHAGTSPTRKTRA